MRREVRGSPVRLLITQAPHPTRRTTCTPHTHPTRQEAHNAHPERGSRGAREAFPMGWAGRSSLAREPTKSPQTPLHNPARHISTPIHGPRTVHSLAVRARTIANPRNPAKLLHLSTVHSLAVRARTIANPRNPANPPPPFHCPLSSRQGANNSQSPEPGTFPLHLPTV